MPQQLSELDIHGGLLSLLEDRNVSSTATTTAAVWTIEPEFTFTDEELAALTSALSSTTVSPYRNYATFTAQVTEIIRAGGVPQRFADYVATLAGRDRTAQPVVVIKNGPYDHNVPVFDFSEPVKSKYDLKTTFVAEAMLSLFAQLCGTPAIGYVNVNDGDVFQDIYPKQSMSTSQSQKALKEIHFHKDLANHFVRPDQVYMVGMRSHPENQVYTSFVRNVDIWPAFTTAELELLRTKAFYTPFDDLSTAGGKELGDADKHPVLGPIGDLRYFEGRTRGLSPEAEVVLRKLDERLHALKQRVFIEPGDFVVTYNNYTIHAKEVVKVADEALLRTRWIIKTVNVDAIAPHLKHLVPGTDYLVNG
jgi:L-asparagine oxygenase